MHDLLVIGAGILGTSLASAAREAGMRVALVERNPLPQDASVRNFGILLPFIVPSQAWVGHALHTRRILRGLSGRFDFGFQQPGTMLVARSEEESRVANEFAAIAAQLDMKVEPMSPGTACSHNAVIRPEGVEHVLYFPHHVILDPRALLHQWIELLGEDGATVRTATTATRVEPSEEGVEVQLAGGERLVARHVILCSGSDIHTLFANEFTTSGLRVCKLQMMRTARQPESLLSTVLVFGRSMARYPLFRHCPSYPALVDALAHEDLDRFGIQLMMRQDYDDSIILGDSHEYGRPGHPHGDATYASTIEEAILDLAREAVDLPDWRITQRWLGYYTTHDTEPIIHLRLGPGIHALTGLTSAMTTGPGLAHHLVQQLQDSGDFTVAMKSPVIP